MFIIIYIFAENKFENFHKRNKVMGGIKENEIDNNTMETNYKVKTELENIVETEIVSLFLKDTIETSNKIENKDLLRRNKYGTTKK